MKDIHQILKELEMTRASLAQLCESTGASKLVNPDSDALKQLEQEGVIRNDRKNRLTYMRYGGPK